MKASTHRANTILANPWFLISNAILGIVTFMWFLYGNAGGMLDPSSVALSFSALALLSIGYVYSIKVRLENIALRSISELFYEINEIYRDKLRELFNSDSPVTDPIELIEEESRALKAVCQRIESIYSRVINRSCMVTLKLVTTEGDKCYAHTYIRSQELCRRDSVSRVRYSIGSGENTGFDLALATRPDGLPSHFYSPDLRVLERNHAYFNERQHYQRYYRSTLVVPIRGRNSQTENSAPAFDLVGFLCVDTLSTYRLNNGYHLFMLSALASQMYNFMSLMRGKYTVVVG